MNKKPKNILFDYKSNPWTSKKIKKPFVKYCLNYLKEQDISLEKVNQLADDFCALHQQGQQALKNPDVSQRLTTFLNCTKDELATHLVWASSSYESRRDKPKQPYYLIDSFLFERFFHHLGFQSHTYTDFDSTMSAEQERQKTSIFVHSAGFFIEINEAISDLASPTILRSQQIIFHQHQRQSIPISETYKDPMSKFLAGLQTGSGQMTQHGAGTPQWSLSSEVANRTFEFQSTSTTSTGPVFTDAWIFICLYLKTMKPQPTVELLISPSTEHPIDYVINALAAHPNMPRLQALQEHLVLSKQTKSQEQTNIIHDERSLLFERALTEAWDADQKHLCFTLLRYLFLHHRMIAFKGPNDQDWQKYDLHAAKNNSFEYQEDYELQIGSIELASIWHRRWKEHQQKDSRYLNHLPYPYKSRLSTASHLIQTILQSHWTPDHLKQYGFNLPIEPFQIPWMESSLLFFVKQYPCKSILNPIDMEALEERCQASWSKLEVVHPFNKGITLIDAILNTFLSEIDPHLNIQATLNIFKSFLNTIPQECFQTWATQQGADHLTGPQRLLSTLLGGTGKGKSPPDDHLELLSTSLELLHQKIDSHQWVWETPDVNINGLISASTGIYHHRSGIWQAGLKALLESPHCVSIQQQQTSLKILQSDPHHHIFYTQESNLDLQMYNNLPATSVGLHHGVERAKTAHHYQTLNASLKEVSNHPPSSKRRM